MRVLVVEDEADLASTLNRVLTEAHFAVDVATDGEEAQFMLGEVTYDAVVLDLMVPKRSGWSLLQDLRQSGSKTPVLILTARDGVDDRVLGLDLGADDYLVKPFSTDELLARVRALLRRVKKPGSSTDRLEFNGVRIDFAQQKASHGKTELHLTAKEFAMLRLLADAHGEPISRERFLDLVWGYGAFPTTRTVDNHIASLRSKIEKDPDNPKFIKTVHGVGYRLELPEITKA